MVPHRFPCCQRGMARGPTHSWTRRGGPSTMSRCSCVGDSSPPWRWSSAGARPPRRRPQRRTLSRVHLTLAAHRVVAGHPIKGTVVLDQHLGPCDHRATRVPSTGGSRSVSAGTGSRPRSSTPPWAATPRSDSPPAPPALRVTVVTTYTTCSQSEPGGNAPSPSSPNCTVSNGKQVPPPLPAGRYSTVVQLVGLDGEAQPANRLVVTLSAPAKPPTVAPCAVVPGTATPTVTVPNVVGLSSSLAALSLAHACLTTGYASPVGTHV